MMVEQQHQREMMHAVLAKHWGFTAFRPMQERVIREVLEGRDTLALLPTGGGKSLCFQVPAMVTGKLCLVVSPLIALMKDQVERLRSKGMAARAITSGMRPQEIENSLEAAALGKLSLLYVSPERLGTELFLARLPRMPLGLIAVDEAHCISQWGYDFRPSYLRIRDLRLLIPKVPLLALTASATAEVAYDIMRQLDFEAPNLLRGDFRRPELVLWVSEGEDKYGRLLRIMQNVPGTSIVYMRERKGTVRIAHFLKGHGIAAEAYHAGLTSTERDRIQRAWSDGVLRCVVATNAFGMGIDKADVRSVVHMEAPPDLESYYQEAGRCGRDGKTAYAFLLTGPGDEQRARERLRNGFPALSEVRRVYQAFADMNGIAMGAGLHETYAFDMRALAERTKLTLPTVANALKALELGGFLVLSEGARSPSRLLFTTSQQAVYSIRVKDQRHGPLIEALLRLHGGLFEEAAVIDEERLARLLGLPTHEVEKRLQELMRAEVLSYQQRSEKPSATLLVQRADADRLALDPTALADRQQRAAKRLEAMIDYTRPHGRCRMATLLAYFNEPEPRDCGQCDTCKARKAQHDTNGAQQVEEPLGHYHRDIEAERWRKDEYGEGA